MKYKIGEFSKLTKVTVKTLRYYDEVGILKPAHIDRWNNYRYYLQSQMGDLCRIRDYRDAGLSIEDIRSIVNGEDPEKILMLRKNELEDRIAQISKIMEKIKMTQYTPELKTLPSVTVAYMHGIIPTYKALTPFVFEFASECQKTNPQLKCSMDYCFVTYTKQEYQDKDIELTYAQAVDEAGTKTDKIGFRKLDEVLALCVKHYGPYSRLGDAYKAITDEISSKGYTIIGDARECYIDGCWNKDSEEEYLTEIQIPVKTC